MRHVLVTGAAGGIGLACARAFHALGDTVTGVDARQRELAEAMKPLGGRAFTTDLSDPDCGEVVDRAAATAPVDVLVNAAGIYPATPLADMTARAWDQVQHVNVRAPMRERVLAAVERIVMAEATAAGAPRPPEIATINDFPLLVNDESAARRVIAAFSESLGAAVVHEPPMKPASEDFGRFGAATGVPSVFWNFGGFDPAHYPDPARPANAVAAGGAPGNHSPQLRPRGRGRGTAARHRGVAHRRVDLAHLTRLAPPAKPHAVGPGVQAGHARPAGSSGVASWPGSPSVRRRRFRSAS